MHEQHHHNKLVLCNQEEESSANHGGHSTAVKPCAGTATCQTLPSDSKRKMMLQSGQRKPPRPSRQDRVTVPRGSPTKARTRCPSSSSGIVRGRPARLSRTLSGLTARGPKAPGMLPIAEHSNVQIEARANQRPNGTEGLQTHKNVREALAGVLVRHRCFPVAHWVRWLQELRRFLGWECGPLWLGYAVGEAPTPGWSLASSDGLKSLGLRVTCLGGSTHRRSAGSCASNDRFCATTNL